MCARVCFAHVLDHLSHKLVDGEEREGGRAQERPALVLEPSRFHLAIQQLRQLITELLIAALGGQRHGLPS